MTDIYGDLAQEVNVAYSPLTHDYRAVISQIKREILIEISGHPHHRPVSLPQVKPEIGIGSYGLCSLSDAELKEMLAMVAEESSRRGLLEKNSGRLPKGMGEMGASHTLLAALLFPPVRQRMEEILCQTAMDGLGIVRQVGSLLEKAAQDITTMMDSR